MRGIITIILIIAVFLLWPFVWAARQDHAPTRHTTTCPASQTNWLGYCEK